MGHIGTPWDTSHRKHFGNIRIHVDTIWYASLLYLSILSSIYIFTILYHFTRMHQIIIDYIRDCFLIRQNPGVAHGNSHGKALLLYICAVFLRTKSCEGPGTPWDPLGWWERERQRCIAPDFGKWFTCLFVDRFHSVAGLHQKQSYL